MDISSYRKAQVLAALYNAAGPVGLGWLRHDPTPMTEVEAEAFLAGDMFPDYIKGRKIGVNFRSNEIDLCIYDRDHGGPGAGERAILAACAPQKKRAG